MPSFKKNTQPIEKLNNMTADEKRAALLACCGSTRWAEEVSALLPMWDVVQLLIIGERIWGELAREDWLEAFRAHPRIGEKKAEAEVSEAARRWSDGEQSRASAASQETLDALAGANREYEEKFGFIFIVCATNRSAEQMLSHLRERMKNDEETEIRIAAEEQWRITELRIKKLLNV
ncbi:MAG TPA: 2-oxo-4-hydroxy-4-carboxy-5-ureidoimidazoline decarboxylase [Pyrinomonadaceae bacterium]|nr:2-oxo-4-hydroxy-4-carboxy-5-ureidoimidazoline decarboxylase [Pyrinomonadaceae bacterium]